MSDPLAEMPEWEKALARDMERMERIRCGGCGKTARELVADEARRLAAAAAAE